MLSEEFLGLVAHELRTPVAAIIGYHDLMTEGLFGELEPRVAEGVDRMRSSANQILALVAGLAEAATHDPTQLHVEVQPEDPREILESVIVAIGVETLGRSTTLDIQQIPRSVTFHTDADRLRRALLLVLHALVKNTAGGTLQVRASVVEGTMEVVIGGARINPATDMPPPNGTLAAASACALRLGMAAHTIRPLGGSITLNGDSDAGILTVRVPETARRD